jgi:spermidine synthase
MARNKKTAIELPEVSVSDDGEVRHLHLGTPWIQGSMRVDEPFEIELQYVQRMMAWLLFVEPASPSPSAMPCSWAWGPGPSPSSATRNCACAPRPSSSTRRCWRCAASGSSCRPMAPSCAWCWPMRPRKSANPMWLGTVDALAVDLYDHEAAAPVLDSPDFYADCRALLTEDGCMTVNLFGRASSFERSLQEHGQRPLAKTRCGPSSPPARATPWCWRSARPAGPSAPSWRRGRGHPGALGSALCPSGCACSSPL